MTGRYRTGRLAAKRRRIEHGRRAHRRGTARALRRPAFRGWTPPMANRDRTSRLSAKWRRLVALMRKETWQLLRDPSSIAIGIVMPVILILLFGYGLSLDVTNVPVAVVMEDSSADAREIAAGFQLSRYFDATLLISMPHAEQLMIERKIDGIIRLRSDFSRRLAAGQWRPTAEIWERRLYDRMIAMSKVATPLQRGQLVTALGAGIEIRRLRELADAVGEQEGVHRVLSALAAGDSEQARAGATVLVDRLAPQAGANGPVNMQRLCAYLDEIEEALASHPAFFDRRG